MAHLLVIDDEQSICWGLLKLAERMGHTASSAASAEQGLNLARQQQPDMVFLDIRLPGMDGLEALARFRNDFPRTPVVIITAYGDLGTAVAAVRNGAFDYLTKPFDLQVAQRAIQRALQARQEPAAGPPGTTPLAEGRMVGRCPAMQEVFKRIALVAPVDACVHIRGESGTGKELVARAIHRYSRRASGPFVAVNVASLSPTLAESELFGHVRGAFTGADQARKGLLEQASGGTLFLDEVAEIPISVQVKLLRALEHGEVLPVGASQPVAVDLRIISATHQNLAELAAEGRFRHDLYYRLVTFEIEIPPLRQRREDIPELTEYFLDLLAAKNGAVRPSVSPQAMAELSRRPWYGNVRELRNAIEHALIMARGGSINPEHLPPPALPMPSGQEAGEEKLRTLIRRWTKHQLEQNDQASDLYQRFLRLVEPPMLQTALEHYHGQCAAAARRLGLHRSTLRKRLDEIAKDQ